MSHLFCFSNRPASTSVCALARKTMNWKSLKEKIINYHESVIYFLAPLRYATIYGCSDETIVFGAVGKAVRIDHCERVHLISPAKHILIANCHECVLFIWVKQ